MNQPTADDLAKARDLALEIWNSKAVPDETVCTTFFKICVPIIAKEIAAALVEARAVPQWLPIDSAPKDGTRILCWNGFSVRITRWYNNQFYNDGCVKPTHWQPLPAAPNPPIAEVKK